MPNSNYAMESLTEAFRLERQALLPAYQLQDELRDFIAGPGERILDAGCGSGLLGRYLLDRFPDITVEACDFSSDRLDTARSLAKTPLHQRIRFFQSDLEKVEAEDRGYDQVICRFVLEHCRSPERVVTELLRVLKPGGKLWVIDWDGIVLNLHPVSQDLDHQLKLIEAGYPGDLRIGRKLPTLLRGAGFQSVAWRVEAISFQGESLRAELAQTEERLIHARSILAGILGSELEAQRFKNLYCSEMAAPDATLFYNKFITIGTR